MKVIFQGSAREIAALWMEMRARPEEPARDLQAEWKVRRAAPKTQKPVPLRLDGETGLADGEALEAIARAMLREEGVHVCD